MPNKMYAFISHTIKAQKENMPLLDAIMDKVCDCLYIVIVPDAEQDIQIYVNVLLQHNYGKAQKENMPLLDAIMDKVCL